MKTHFNKLRPLALLLALFMLTNCQEDYIENSEDRNGIIDTEMKIIKRPFSQFEKLPGLLEKTIPRNKLSKSKDLIDIYDFEIDKTEVIEITTEFGTFYTMLIKRDADSGNTFENLILSDANDEQKAFIISYTPEEEYYTRAEKLFYTPFIGEIKYTEIDRKVLEKNSISWCQTVTLAFCGNNGGLAGPGCLNNEDHGAHVYTRTFKFCETMEVYPYITSGPVFNSLVNIKPGGGGGGKGSDGYDAGYEDGDEIPNTDEQQGTSGPVKPGLFGPVTIPVGPDEDCKNLKKLTQDPTIKKALNDLKARLSSADESLYKFNKNSNGGTVTGIATATSGASVRVNITSNTYGVAHTHQNGPLNNSGLYKMFSFSDFAVVYSMVTKFQGLGQNAAPIIFNMMVIDGYTYIVFPNSKESLKGLDFIFEDRRKVDRLNNKIRDIYAAMGPYNQVSDLSLAEKFLQFMNNAGSNGSGTNFNISLFRIKNDDNHEGDWEKLELDPDNYNNLKEPKICS